jgi:hypothetical protein
MATFIDENRWLDQRGMHQLAHLLRWIESMDSRIFSQKISTRDAA